MQNCSAAYDEHGSAIPAWLEYQVDLQYSTNPLLLLSHEGRLLQSNQNDWLQTALTLTSKKKPSSSKKYRCCCNYYYYYYYDDFIFVIFTYSLLLLILVQWNLSIMVTRSSSCPHYYSYLVQLSSDVILYSCTFVKQPPLCNSQKHLAYRWL